MKVSEARQDMDMTRALTFEIPTKVVFGLRVSQTVGEELRRLGATRALVVTDSGLVQLGMAEKVVQSLAGAGIEVCVFAGVRANPTMKCVMECHDAFLSHGCDSLVGFGGGSSIDTAKAAGILVNNNVPLSSLEGVGKVEHPLPPLIAIPTTCGTGSEVTNVTIITNQDRSYKMPIVSPHLFPRVALVDPGLLVDLPSDLIASTGVDALTHAIEAYTNLNANPLTDAVAMKAIELIFRYLRPAVANKNLEALCGMALGSTMAGMAFAIARLGLVHAMSHPVSGYAGVAHGVANAILLPYVMEFNLIGAVPRFAEIAAIMGGMGVGLTQLDRARLAVECVRELSRDIGIPATLQEVGVKEEMIPSLVSDAMKSGNILINPRRPTVEQVKRIYETALKGN